MLAGTQRVGREFGSSSSIPKFSSNYAPGVAAGAAGAQGVTAQDPVYVSMVEGSFKNNMWKTLRTLGVAFLVVSALGAILDEKVGKIGGATKISSATGSDKRFSDVKGASEAKEELEEIVQFLKVRWRCCAIGSRMRAMC